MSTYKTNKADTCFLRQELRLMRESYKKLEDNIISSVAKKIREEIPNLLRREIKKILRKEKLRDEIIRSKSANLSMDNGQRLNSHYQMPAKVNTRPDDPYRLGAYWLFTLIDLTSFP
jgi:uncharacterized protein YbaR (Trm112 family)